MEGDTSAGNETIALVGPGRAGTTITLALLERGWRAVAVAGRAPDAPSTTSAAACLGADASLVSECGRGASLVIVATPDRAIGAAARAVGSVVRAGRARIAPRRIQRPRRVRVAPRSTTRRPRRRVASVAVVSVGHDGHRTVARRLGRGRRRSASPGAGGHARHAAVRSPRLRSARAITRLRS